MSPAMEQALEVATDAITRRARVLDGQDPDVSEALRALAASLETYAPKWVPAAERRKVDS